MNKVEIPVELVDKYDSKLPTYAHDGDAGMDVYAREEVIIRPQETVIVPIGIKVAIPLGYEIQVRPRSGVSLKTPLRLSNCVGTIDANYKDEIGVIITNTSLEDDFNHMYDLTEKDNRHGEYYIKKGDRIAQIVLKKQPVIDFKLVDSVADIGEDRGGGFGSSGVNDIQTCK